MNPAAVIFDVDGTLAPLNSWEALTEALGSPRGHLLSIYTNYKQHIIDTVAARQQVLDLWCRTSRPTRTELQEIFRSLPIRPEAHELVYWLKSRGYDICIISGSMDIYVTAIAKQLSIPSHFSNATLIFDEQGLLVDLTYTLDQSTKKVEQLRTYLKQRGLGPQQVLVVGNGTNDLGLFEYTGRGILLETGHSETLRDRSWRVIHNLSELKNILTFSEEPEFLSSPQPQQP